MSPRPFSKILEILRSLKFCLNKVYSIWGTRRSARVRRANLDLQLHGKIGSVERDPSLSKSRVDISGPELGPDADQ